MQKDYKLGLLQSIENKEFDDNNFKNKFINGIKGILNTQDKLDTEKINKKIKEIDSEKKIMSKNGISEQCKIALLCNDK